MIQHENREVQRAIEAFASAQKFAEECKKEEMAEPRKMGLGKKLAIGAALAGAAALGVKGAGVLRSQARSAAFGKLRGVVSARKEALSGLTGSSFRNSVPKITPSAARIRRLNKGLDSIGATMGKLKVPQAAR